MKHVERHIIKRSHSIWQQIDKLCFLSKNLYNYANYQIRQAFIFDKIYLGYNKVYHACKSTPDYQALPAKVSQQVLRLLEQNWKSFLNAIKAYKIAPDKFKGRPKLPRYKDKNKGRNLLVYTIQAISKPWLKKGIVKLSGVDILIPTKVENIDQVRVIPKTGQYVIEVVYEKKESYTVHNPNAVASIDIGINNLCALTSNQLGFIPILINGRPLKSLNQLYNKTFAKLQSLLPSHQLSSNRIKQLAAKRNNQVNNYLHKASRWIINHLDKHGIGKLIIGNNEGWKQSVNLGKQVNQSFTTIPHARLIEMLFYKGQLQGIEVIVREESYTSRASFLSLDPIPSYGDDNAREIKFSGYRESRGMYKERGLKTRINSDISSSYNIMRKVIPEIFNRRGIKGVVVRPVRITPN
ncbi:transposase [Hyella patelloides LEGE 07179]|uniref:Transposase n=1 Tax=Hyella patelloides LEGE 07179 TaxID=945734 RepID=A0A563VZU9_9CYAN|nr:RNA-guided endonuclease TnpB family protein [Hyella patelloides]VEP16974.1 transposase [Hyella patelloides LEGE 07179]